MNKKLILATEAEEDLVRLREFLYRQALSMKVVQRFDYELDVALNDIVDFPESSPFAEDREPIRKKIQWKYLFFYVELTDVITILRIFHQKEDWVESL